MPPLRGLVCVFTFSGYNHDIPSGLVLPLAKLHLLTGSQRLTATRVKQERTSPKTKPLLPKSGLRQALERRGTHYRNLSLRYRVQNMSPNLKSLVSNLIVRFLPFPNYPCPLLGKVGNALSTTFPSLKSQVSYLKTQDSRL
jgi:hypothetical protein